MHKMSEHDAAAIWGLWALYQSLLDDGVLPPDRLLGALKALRDNFSEMGARNAAATIDMIISCIEQPRRRRKS
jgi:hypothetical protein